MPTLEQIRAKMHTLQQQADALIARQAQKVVDQIRSLMIEHGLTTADIEAAAKKRRQRGAAGTTTTKGSKAAKASKAAGEGKAKLPAKYRNPKTGETWSGHARPPAWIANARDRSRFLIDEAASAVTTATRAVSGKASQAGQALYRDPETGKTWTGHGRAPAWIADAADRSVYLIGKRGAGKKTAAKPVVKTAAKKIAKKAATKAAAKSATKAVKKTAKKAATKAATKTATKTAAKTARKTIAAKLPEAQKPAAKRARKTPSARSDSIVAPAPAQLAIDTPATPDSQPTAA